MNKTEREMSFTHSQIGLGVLFLIILGATTVKIPKGIYSSPSNALISVGNDEEQLERIGGKIYIAIRDLTTKSTSLGATIDIGRNVDTRVKKGFFVHGIKRFVGKGETLVLENGIEISHTQE